MSNRRQQFGSCDQRADERFFPISKVGQILVFVGLGLAFLSFVFGFWLAFLGAVLVLIGYLVIQNC